MAIFISHANVKDYFVNMGLAESSEEVELVENKSRRNSNNIVLAGESRYFLKQYIDKSFEIEPDFYLRSDKALNNLIPNFRKYDSENKVLITEHVGGRPLLEFFISKYKSSPKRLTEISSKAGVQFRILHERLRLSNYEGAKITPWALNIISPSVDNIREMGQGAFEFLRLCQNNEEIVDNVKYLRSNWDSSQLIHGDIKLDNIVVGDDDNLVFVDWEMAQLGSPYWDNAGYIASLLSMWIFSIPKSMLNQPNREQYAEFEFSEVEKSITGFTLSYYGSLQKKDANLLTRYTSLRLSQSAYELCRENQALDGYTVLLIQLAVNLLNKSIVGMRYES